MKIEEPVGQGKKEEKEGGRAGSYWSQHQAHTCFEPKNKPAPTTDKCETDLVESDGGENRQLP